MTAVMAVSLTPTVQAADANHYELIGWKADGTGINFTYQGPMGTGSAGLPCGELLYSHAKDTSWTGADSVAPILAYIKAYGVTSAIKDCINPSVYDPSIFQALSGQGVNLSALGGPNVPPGSTPPSSLVGKAIVQMPAASAHIVGLGIPAPDLSSIASTSTPKPVTNPTPAPAQPVSQQPSSSTTTSKPNPPIPQTSTQSGNNASAQTQSQPSSQAVIPQTQTDSGKTEVAATTPTGPVIPPKVVPPDLQQQDTQSSSQKQSPWKIWLTGGLAVVVALGGGTFGFIKWKQRNL